MENKEKVSDYFGRSFHCSQAVLVAFAVSHIPKSQKIRLYGRGMKNVALRNGLILV